MTSRALIVEDEILVALDMESALQDQGVEVVGIAADHDSAMQLATNVDFALVDVNLRDGQTGPAIGRALALHGVKVIFVTANPAQLAGGVEGTLGVMSKPFSGDSITATIDYIRAPQETPPPRELKLFA